jgi:hypothetical protein
LNFVGEGSAGMQWGVAVLFARGARMGSRDLDAYGVSPPRRTATRDYQTVANAHVWQLDCEFEH